VSRHWPDGVDAEAREWARRLGRSSPADHGHVLDAVPLPVAALADAAPAAATATGGAEGLMSAVPAVAGWAFLAAGEASVWWLLRERGSGLFRLVRRSAALAAAPLAADGPSGAQLKLDRRLVALAYVAHKSLAAAAAAADADREGGDAAGSMSTAAAAIAAANIGGALLLCDASSRLQLWPLPHHRLGDSALRAPAPLCLPFTALPAGRSAGGVRLSVCAGGGRFVVVSQADAGSLEVALWAIAMDAAPTPLAADFRPEGAIPLVLRPRLLGATPLHRARALNWSGGGAMVDGSALDDAAVSVSWALIECGTGAAEEGVVADMRSGDVW
jgi:hypothetical protein